VRGSYVNLAAVEYWVQDAIAYLLSGLGPVSARCALGPDIRSYGFVIMLIMRSWCSWCTAAASGGTCYSVCDGWSPSRL